MRLCVVKHIPVSETESFIRAHVERLSDDAYLLDGVGYPRYEFERRPVSLPARTFRHAMRSLDPRDSRSRRTAGYIRRLKALKPDVVLAEYGLTGTQVMDACTDLDIPLVVHFHGYDVSRTRILEDYGRLYEELAARAAAFVAVSRAMKERLIRLGAPEDRVVVNPCGVDVNQFSPTSPGKNPPTFLAVGRLVEKKAPHLVVEAFRQAHSVNTSLRLRIVGDGPLMDVCRELVSSSGLSKAVDLLGSLPHDDVRHEMQRSRALLQHSVVASDGDREGTPVSVLEAGSSALPVIATAHEGISDVVLNGETGILVSENNTNAMSEAILTLANEPEYAARLGRAARRRVEAHFSMKRSLDRLRRVLEAALERRSVPSWDESFGSEHPVETASRLN